MKGLSNHPGAIDLASTSSSSKWVSDRIPGQILSTIQYELRKTRLCTEFQDGLSCQKNVKCCFVHIAGPDARKVLGMSDNICRRQSAKL